MHLISHQPPKGLALRDIVCIQIELDFILTLVKLHGGTVMALVDVFVNVLDSLDQTNTLHVDIAPVLPEQNNAEWNNTAIIDLLAIGKSV